MRSLFGVSGSSKGRAVIGSSVSNVSIDLKDVEYIKDSSARLATLYDLYKRYKGTPHEQKLKAVWEKTSSIHSYLIAKNRVHELELFHIQHTEHFINTFTVIIDVFLKHDEIAAASSKIETRAQTLFNKLKEERINRRDKYFNQTEMVKPMNGQRSFFGTDESKTDVPILSVPEITINTYTKIPYRKEHTTGVSIPNEIGFTSTPQDKEIFLLYISAQLGIENVSYVGNAMVNIPNSNGTNPTGFVPIIHWEGFLYAVNLNDYRIFPVKMSRKSQGL